MPMVAKPAVENRNTAPTTKQAVAMIFKMKLFPLKSPRIPPAKGRTNAKNTIKLKLRMVMSWFKTVSL